MHHGSDSSLFISVLREADQETSNEDPTSDVTPGTSNGPGELNTITPNISDS